MRVNKYLTDQGFCSRREADKLISLGRVRINEKLAVLGDQVVQGDSVFVDGSLVSNGPKKVYIIYHKPVGITCTTERAVTGNIIDAVNHPQRIFPVGRLDKDSSGLIILTSDGDIVNQILRSENAHEKEYVVEVNKPIDYRFIDTMASGVDIGGYVTKKCVCEVVGKNTFRIILTEGKNRQIRRMSEVLGFKVKHLKRIRIMNLEIGNLKPSSWKDIPPEDLKRLMESLSARY